MSKVVSAQWGGGVFQNHVSVEKLMKMTSTCVELTFKPFPTLNALFKCSFKQFKGKRSGETLTMRSVHSPTPVCRCSSETDRVVLPTQQTFSAFRESPFVGSRKQRRIYEANYNHLDLFWLRHRLLIAPFLICLLNRYALVEDGFFH